MSQIENIRLSYPAQQALIATALNVQIGGINAFTTVIGRCITMARATYYTTGGRSFPDKTKCIRTVSPAGRNYPGAELIITPPVTPEPLMIDEHIVSRMLSEYKSYFPVRKQNTLPMTANRLTTLPLEKRKMSASLLTSPAICRRIQDSDQVAETRDACGRGGDLRASFFLFYRSAYVRDVFFI